MKLLYKQYNYFMDLEPFKVIHIAVIREDVSNVRILLRDCPEYTGMTNDAGETPLHIAAEASRHPLELVTLLVDHGADPSAEDIIGNTPLSNAIRAENLTAALYLLRNEASVENVTIDNRRKMFSLVYRDYFFYQKEPTSIPEMLDFLDDTRRDLHEYGWLPIHFLAALNLFDEAQYTVKYHRNIGDTESQAETETKETPLDLVRRLYASTLTTVDFDAWFLL